MFEDSLFASKGQKRTARARLSAICAVAVQGLLLLGLLVTPMLRPMALPSVTTAPAVVNIRLRRPEIKPEPVKARPAVTENSAIHLPTAAASAPVIESRAGGSISHPSASPDAAPLLALTGGMGSGVVPGIGTGRVSGEGETPVVRAKSSETLRISSGVSSGMLLGAIRPVYPAIARAAGVSGTVVIAARIDKTGRITGAQVMSGPGMLRSAALEALSEARYKPFLLNGEPVEVETTVVINFKMGG